MNIFLITFSMSIFLHYGYMFYICLLYRDLSRNITDTSLPFNSFPRVFSLSLYLLPRVIPHPHSHLSRAYTVLSAFAPYSPQLRLIPRTKRHLRRFLSVPRMHSAHAIALLVAPRFSAFHLDDNSRADDDNKLQPGYWVR